MRTLQIRCQRLAHQSGRGLGLRASFLGASDDRLGLASGPIQRIGCPRLGVCTGASGVVCGGAQLGLGPRPDVGGVHLSGSDALPGHLDGTVRGPRELGPQFPGPGCVGQVGIAGGAGDVGLGSIEQRGDGGAGPGQLRRRVGQLGLRTALRVVDQACGLRGGRLTLDLHLCRGVGADPGCLVARGPELVVDLGRAAPRLGFGVCAHLGSVRVGLGGLLGQSPLERPAFALQQRVVLRAAPL